MERSAYHYRIQKSITFKDSLSVVIDGSEMSRYGLPYFCVSDKSTTDGNRHTFFCLFPHHVRMMAARLNT
jgi:azurin